MPSVLIGNQSGGQPLFSGNFWSGVRSNMCIQLTWAPYASGLAYVGFSGGVTMNSGGVLQSGTAWVGGLDGAAMAPGDSMLIPPSCLQSGYGNIYVLCDAAASGQGRMYYDGR